MAVAELKAGALQQGRVIGALVLREMRTRFGEYRMGYAWAFIEPLVAISIMSAMFYMLGSRPPLGTSYEAFFFTGFVSFEIYRDLSTKTAAAITGNRALLSLPPVRNVDAIWARLLLEVMTATGVAGFVAVTLIYMGVPIAPVDLGRFLLGYMSLIVLGTGFGVFNAVVNPIFRPWSMMFSWFVRIQFFTSGVFFLPERLPPAAIYYIKWSPAVHCLALVREGFYGTYRCNILDETYPFLFGAVLILLGLTIEKFHRKKLSTR